MTKPPPPFICSICQRLIAGSYGNNAEPVNDGRCCDSCDSLVVIPARLRQMARADPDSNAARVLNRAADIQRMIDEKDK